MRIAIIGAGLIGVSTAYFLARAGHSVAVFDRRDGPGLETSYANGGMITPSQADPWNAPGIAMKLLRWIGREDAPVLLRARSLPSMVGWGLEFLRNSNPARFRDNLAKNVRLARYSLETLQWLRRNADLHYSESAAGTMKFYRDPRSLRDSAWLTRELVATGVRCEVLDAQDVVAREPTLAAVAGEIAGGVFFPDDESGDAYQYCVSLARLATAAGVEFNYGLSIDSIRCTSGAVDALRAQSRDIRADCYVLAAGSYSSNLARSAGVRVPVQPVKGYSVTLDMRGWDQVPATPLVDDDLHLAATPLAGSLRIAGTAEFAGYDPDPREQRIRPMLEFTSRLFPRQAPCIALSNAKPWAGLRPYSCDGVPIVSRTRLSNLFVNTGHGHLGWSMAAGSGKLMADLICGSDTAIAPSPYSLERFGQA